MEKSRTGRIWLNIAVIVVGFVFGTNLWSYSDAFRKAELLSDIVSRKDEWRSNMDASYRRLQRGEIISICEVPFLKGKLKVMITDSWGEYSCGFIELPVKEIELESEKLDVWKYDDRYIFIKFETRDMYRG